MEYMITDGYNYIRRDIRGNYTPVKSMALGDVWENKTKAVNVLNSCLNKNLRERYKIIEVENPNLVVSAPAEKKTIKITKIEKKIAEQISEEKQTSEVYVWIQKITEMTKIIIDAENRKLDLQGKLSKVDQEISDIQHYIEFGNFNCYEGWLAFKMLKSKLADRRKIKDELIILQQLAECRVNSEMLNQLLENISGEKKYVPRVLKELFE